MLMESSQFGFNEMQSEEGEQFAYVKLLYL